MKRALLLGDSIRVGYQNRVKDLLRTSCDVDFPNENGRFVQYTYWQLNQMFRLHGRYDVVHFNNGYWDMNIEAPMTEPLNPLPEYLHGLEKIVAHIRACRAVPVFANSAPIFQSGMANDNTGVESSITYRNEWVMEYNSAAEALMKANGVLVNDLYSALLVGPRYFKCDDNLHLTDEGNEVCALKVAECINASLGILTIQ